MVMRRLCLTFFMWCNQCIFFVYFVCDAMRQSLRSKFMFHSVWDGSFCIVYCSLLKCKACVKWFFFFLSEQALHTSRYTTGTQRATLT